MSCRPFTLLSAMDLADVAGEIVMTLDAQDITLASTTWFRSPLAFLNGLGSEDNRDLPTLIGTVGTGLGTWDIGISATTGRLYVTNDTETFTLTVVGTAGEMFGFGAAGSVLNSAVSGGLNRIDAPAAPTPGNITNGHIRLDPAGAGAAFNLPSTSYRAQSVWTLMRKSDGSAGTPDADQNNATDNLQYLINEELDSLNRRFTCGLDSTGRGWIAWPTALGSVADPTWYAAGLWLQRMLGATGSESSANTAGTLGNVAIVTFDNPCLAALAVSRPAQRTRVYVDEEANPVRLTSREIVSNLVLSRRSWEVEFFVDGPADANDLTQHAVRFFQLAPVGSVMEAHLVWGDPRRAIRTLDVLSTPATGETRPAYSSLYTSADNGLGGRLVCRRGLDDAARKLLTAEQGANRRISLTVQLEEAEDGI